MRKAGLVQKSSGPLRPRGVCPACTSGNNGAQNALHVLCEELQKDGEVRVFYQGSNGLCLPHLRDAIEQHSRKFPGSVQLLIDDSVQRLEAQSRDMKEYIRKANWAYRDEKTTEAEDTAWRKTWVKQPERCANPAQSACAVCDGPLGKYFRSAADLRGSGAARGG
jgi:hypothetical protein